MPVDTIAIEFRYRKPALAQRVVRDLAGYFRGETLDEASLPTTPISPNPRTLAIAGLGGGVVIGMVFAFIRRLRKAG